MLEELDKKWIETFHQGVELGYNNDWMEIGICAFNSNTRELQFAGAFNSLAYFAEEKIKFLPGNRYPIGGWQLETQRTFNDHSVVLPENSMLYLYTDGFKDQFGDLSKKRFSRRRFTHLLNSINHLPSNKQMERMENEFNFWKGEESQTDDVCLMGVRL